MTQIVGTIKELVARKLSINGKIVSQPQLSNLTAAGLATEVGKAPKAPGTRGKASTIWAFESQATLSFDAAEVVVNVSAAPITVDATVESQGEAS